MQPHVLFDFLPNDNRDELDDRVQRTYSMLKQMIVGVTTPRECQDIYVKFISVKQHTTQPIVCAPIQLSGSASTTTADPVSNVSVNVASPTTLSAPDNLSTLTTTTLAPTSTTSTNAPTTSTVTNQLPAPNNVQHSNLEDLTMGLLVAILAEPELGQTRYYQDVVSFSKDNLTLFCTYLNMIIIERSTRLREPSLKQIFWLANQLNKSNNNTSENIIFSYIRQIAGGDLSPRNIRSIEILLDFLLENRTWLVNSTAFMVPPVIYTFMRLLVDHTQANLAVLRQKEIDFVIGLIREKFSDCLVIGRDFLRLLFQINKIPEFEKLWHDICNNPKQVHPTLQGPMQILSSRTPRRLILSRLTFDMERKLIYLASQVKFGTQKRYQDLFTKQYLNTNESLSLRSDLIRFICTNIHPSNEVLSSDVVPRWAIVGWLLATCTTNASITNARLALFYDWLVYDSKADNIMNIEPGILVMNYSLRSYPALTSGLLDFFCHLPVLFLPKFSDQLRFGIKKSLSLVVEKRVITSLLYIIDSPKHDPALRALLREFLPEFYPSPQQTTPNQTQPGVATPQPPPVTSTITNSNNSTPSHQSDIKPTITDNGISATFNQISQTNSTSSTSMSQVITPKPPNHLPLGIKQEPHITVDLKTNSPTDAAAINSGVVGLTSIATTTITNRVNNNDSNSMIINTSYGDTVTPSLVSIKEEKLNHNIHSWSVTDRPTSPELMVVDQIAPWQKNNTPTNNDLGNNSKQNAVTRNKASPVSNSSQQPSSSSSEHLNKNNNNMTKTINNQSVTKAQTDSDTSSIVSTSQPSDSIYSKSSNNQTVVSNNSQNLGNLSYTNNDMGDFYDNEMNNSDHPTSCQGPLKVLYPFMLVPEINFKKTIETFSDNIKEILLELKERTSDEDRCGYVEMLISTIFDASGNTTLGLESLKNLGHCLAYIFAEDFSKRIYPSNSTNAFLTEGTRIHDQNQTLELSTCKPLFMICRHVFLKHKSTSSIMTLLVNIYRFFEATGFLVLYFLRANAVIEGFGSNVASHYIDFCNCAKRKQPNKTLLDDLNMALIYDPDLFCFLLPSIFGEMAACGSFIITGNIEIIHLVVSSIDPVHLQELVCLCLTGTAKVINKEDVLPLIESSLNWESWEQYCVWRLICAQSVPVENYLSILPKLNTKTHSEAKSSILLNLQKVTEPTLTMLQTIINCECKSNDPFVSSILRYWSMKTDVHSLANLITSLVDSRPPSPPVKRKGVAKQKSAPTSLTPQTEMILHHLESIRQRAPKNKLLVQSEIIDMIAQLEGLCNESQKKLFQHLFLNRPKVVKKQKKAE